jgi:putative sigma-54 modulation protein
MKIQITGRHINITDAIRDFVNKKFERIERHTDQVTRASMVLNVEKGQHHAEINLHISGKDVVAQTTDKDMYAAIDAAMDKADRQILKHKEKAKAQRKNAEAPVLEEEDLDEDSE